MRLLSKLNDDDTPEEFSTFTLDDKVTIATPGLMIRLLNNKIADEATFQTER
jgi:type VI protein secretion system component Hcp